MRKRYLTLNCTQEEAEYRLKQQLRVYPPRGLVEDNHFKIYRHIPGSFNGNGLRESLYCFYGEYQQSGNCTYVAYRVLPGFSIFLFSLLLTLSILIMVYRVVWMDDEIIMVIVLLAFLLLYTLITQWEKSKCIADFEKRLTTKISWKK